MGSTGTITEPPRRPPQAASAALISAVLGNDDLLREILVRLDFPTCLVRAAAVSKRWLRNASDPAFLRRFRRLHPPRLLGFYLYSSDSDTRLRFIPLSLPPELAAVIRRGKFDLGKGAGRVSDCRNGRLIVYLTPDGRMFGQKTVCRPMHPERGASALPLPHIPALAHDNLTITHCDPKFLFHDDGGDDVAISAVSVMHKEWHAMLRLCDFQSGVWSECRNSDMMKLPGPCRRYHHSALLANGKIYMMCMAQYILGLDVQSMSLFSVKLPKGVEYEYNANIVLSRAEGSGICLVHVRKFQIRVWRYTMDHNSTSNWELVDTICLREVFGPNADPTWCSQAAYVQVAAVGDNAGFVFFRIQKKVFYFHISSRTLEKVYELAHDEFLFGVSVSPFMMVWPPTFPTLNGGHDNDE